MKPQVRIELSLAMLMVLLSACSPAAAEAEVPPPTPTPTCTATMEADQEVEALSDEEVEAQDVATEDIVDQLIDTYMSGETVSVAELSIEQRQEFSIKLEQKLNELRGAKPLIYNNEAYVDPITGMMKDYDGHPDLEETIQMYLAASLDSKGNLLIQNEESTWVKINGSKDIDWNMVVTDPHDTRINWPTDNLNKEGLSTSQYAVAHGAKLIPWVLLNTNLGQLYLDGENAEIKPTFNSVIIETDSVGNPICARRIISFGVSIGLSEEGSDSYIKQPWQSWQKAEKEFGPFYQRLSGNRVYWMISPADQKDMYEGIKNTLDGYENVVDVNNVGSVLNNQKKDDQNMLIVGIRFLIIKELNN